MASVVNAGAGQSNDDGKIPDEEVPNNDELQKLKISEPEVIKAPQNGDQDEHKDDHHKNPDLIHSKGHAKDQYGRTRPHHDHKHLGDHHSTIAKFRQKLEPVKIRLIHAKQHLGKYKNLANRNHRHDEEHEKEVDFKRIERREDHRYGSFAPIRPDNEVKWYVDGRDYMWAVSMALERAKETIYIADWWLSPEVFLRRPPSKNKEWRLDQILKRKAREGVKIYIIVYKEVETVLYCKSDHTKNALEGLCPEWEEDTDEEDGDDVLKQDQEHMVVGTASEDQNVKKVEGEAADSRGSKTRKKLKSLLSNKDEKEEGAMPLANSDGKPKKKMRKGKGFGNIVVMRHPDHNVLEHAGDMTFYWAHHEKFIVIDHKVGFIGGIDLCFGRWDNHQHEMADVHPAGVENEIWPGQDFNNNRIMDFKKVEDWNQNPLEKKHNGRMPWHDVACGVIGDTVLDMAQHFVTRWNFIKRDKYKRDPLYDWLLLRHVNDDTLLGVQRPKHPMGEYIVHPPTPALLPNEAQDQGHLPKGTVNCQLLRSATDWSHGLAPPEDSIAEAYKRVIEEAEHYVYIENQFFITATGKEQSPVQNTIGASIVKAVLRAHEEGRKFRVIIVIPAIPGFPGDLREDSANGTRAIIDYQYKSLYRGEHSIFGRIQAAGINPKDYIYGFNLRTYDRLNKTKALEQQEEETGVSYSERGRANAEELMGKANGKSGKKGDRDDQEKEDEKQKFDAGKKQEMDGQVDSIAKDAMLHGGKVVDETWNGTEEEELQNYVTEELYIHAKVLIADDKVALIGSSNINDRSQLGFHDSEMTMIMEDTNTYSSKMDDKPFEASGFAGTLRRQLWREHLGLLPAQPHDATGDKNAEPVGDSPNVLDPDSEANSFVDDPLSDKLWDRWTEQATNNTGIYRDLFHCDPDDAIKTWKDYDEFLPKNIKPGHIVDQEKRTVKEVRDKLTQIKGHLVWWPLHFLEAEDMAERGLTTGLNQFTESIYT